MSIDDQIDGALLSAFVDGELDGASRAMVMKAMDEDPDVRARVHELRRARDLMQLGFVDERAPRRNPINRGGFLPPTGRLAVAASLLVLAVGLVAGYLGYHHGLNQGIETARATGAEQSQRERIVLHISQSDPSQFALALEYTRHFLTIRPAHEGEVAVIANAGGLDLLRVGGSPYEAQIRALMRDHTNVHFIACADSIRNLRRKGGQPRFIDNVDTSQPAFEQIIRRVQDGWTYKKVEALPAA